MAKAYAGEQALRQAEVSRSSSNQNRRCRVRHILLSPKFFPKYLFDHKQAEEVEQTHAVSPVEKRNPANVTP